ncbi:hypothetical protein CPB84DRAFT_1753922 [Gymnopilus junonius]|uniref:Uncharacterized protein n=1 Tax=Gymnopilus junonius TaxID=109634 RepID=A0A9P5N8B7_GYMJU|nr:hypothetical protein CPB84DRAFT_1753922 [Gymnopilus junonius]
MTLSSWSEVEVALNIKDDNIKEDIKNLIINYVEVNMRIDVLPSEHGPAVYRNLIQKVAKKYKFVQTSTRYPANPTAHEKVIRSFAMRHHNQRRALVNRQSRAERVTQVSNEDTGEESDEESSVSNPSLLPSTITPLRRRHGSVTPETRNLTAKRPKVSTVSSPQSKVLQQFRDHGDVLAFFSVKFARCVGGDSHVDKQVDSMRNKSFLQFNRFVKDVTELDKPLENRWEMFVAAEIMWEYVKRV